MSAALDGIVRPASKGLDRAPLGDFSPPVETSGVSDDKLEESTEVDLAAQQNNGNKSPSVIHRLSKSIKSKFHRDSSDDHGGASDQRRNDRTILAPVLAPSRDHGVDVRLDEAEPPGDDDHDRPDFGEILKSPIQSAKSFVKTKSGGAFSEGLAKTPITHAADVELVRADDKVTNADTEESRNVAEDEMNTMMKFRQNSYVRWTLDRHVHRIRRAKRHLKPRYSAKEFKQIDAQGNMRTKWDEYGQHVRLPGSFEKPPVLSRSIY